MIKLETDNDLKHGLLYAEVWFFLPQMGRNWIKESEWLVINIIRFKWNLCCHFATLSHRPHAAALTSNPSLTDPTPSVNTKTKRQKKKEAKRGETFCVTQVKNSSENTRCVLWDTNMEPTNWMRLNREVNLVSPDLSFNCKSSVIKSTIEFWNEANSSATNYFYF